MRNWEDWLLSAMLAVIGAVIAALIVGLGVMIWWAFNPPPSFSLVRADWSCTADHRETVTSYVLVGKMMVPQIHTNTVCDQWSRNHV